MSVESLAIVLHHSRSRGTAKVVLLGIANHDGDGGAWPTVRTLARYANVDVGNARKALRRLESLGEIRVHLQAGGLPGWDDHDRPNRYDLLIACPQSCDRSKHHRMAGDTTTPPLWMNPPTVSTPPYENVGPPPYENVGLTIPRTPTPTGSASTTDRASCSTCSQPEHVCRARDAKLDPADRHDYAPRDRS